LFSIIGDLYHFLEHAGITPDGQHFKGAPGDDIPVYRKEEVMLTTEQRSRVRARLEQQHEALRLEIADVQGQLAAPEAIVDAVDGQGDDGNMLFAHEQALGELMRLHQTFGQVKRALQRLEARTYRSSEVSGHPIPIERLEALPSATTLVREHLLE
jgi:RNA polymerase-binding transcription factor DksA